jgi:lipid-binding SYLF domain-containing protein
MKGNNRMYAFALSLAAVMVFALIPETALADSARQIDRNSRQALHTLYRTTHGSSALADKAKGVLVFPRIVKAGLVLGG